MKDEENIRLNEVWLSFDEGFELNENVMKLIHFVEWGGATNFGDAKEILRKITPEDFQEAQTDLYYLPTMEAGVEEDFNDPESKEDTRSSLYGCHVHNIVQAESIQRSLWDSLKPKKKKQFF